MADATQIHAAIEAAGIPVDAVSYNADPHELVIRHPDGTSEADRAEALQIAAQVIAGG